MRPCMKQPFSVRGIEYGGARPLFCVPLVADDLERLLPQAAVAHHAAADLVEWRADSYKDLTPAGLIDCLSRLRSLLASEPIIFTLRIRREGGAQDISQEIRRTCIESVAACGLADMVDIELCNETPFLESVIRVAHEHKVRVVLSYHNFDETPVREDLLTKIDMMYRHGADVAKIAVMPLGAADVLRLLEITLEARQRFPQLALCTTSMGRLGTLSRVAGFLFGSDMAYAVVCETSAPGQIPIREARSITEKLFGCDD